MFLLVGPMEITQHAIKRADHGVDVGIFLRLFDGNP